MATEEETEIKDTVETCKFSETETETETETASEFYKVDCRLYYSSIFEQIKGVTKSSSAFESVIHCAFRRLALALGLGSLES